jgi:hypothetical protein
VIVEGWALFVYAIAAGVSMPLILWVGRLAAGASGTAWRGLRSCVPVSSRVTGNKKGRW